MAEHVFSREQKWCLQRCGSYEYYERTRRGFKKGQCEFCNIDRNFNKICYEDEHVLAWSVPQQLKVTRPLKFRLIVIPKRHVRFVSDLRTDELASFFKAAAVLQEQYNYKGGMIIIREGDMELNAGTVPHLHMNIYESTGEKEYRVPLYKSSEQIAENAERAKGFAERYEQEHSVG